MKKLIPALCMLLVAAALLGTSTYAWFSMNTEVTATGMQVQAKAEDGIVIASYSDATTPPVAADFADTDATYITEVTQILPTFTADATKWYHAASTQSNNGQAYTSNGYTEVDNIAGANAVYYTYEEYTALEGNEEVSEEDFNALDDKDKIKTPAVIAVNYYQLNKFQIKSTGAAQDVYVKDITVKVGENESAQEYSPALRVLIKAGTKTLIYAPLSANSGYSFTETAAAATGASDAIESDVVATIFTKNNYNKVASLILDDVTATAQDVSIYVYFDGEDPACKSDNIVDAFEGLTVTVTFTTIAPLS